MLDNSVIIFLTDTNENVTSVTFGSGMSGGMKKKKEKSRKEERETSYTWIPTQQRKFGRKQCKVASVVAGVHETFVITKPQVH
jgi:hypothetical protein